jgi:hypothetical protein
MFMKNFVPLKPEITVLKTQSSSLEEKKPRNLPEAVTLRQRLMTKIVHFVLASLEKRNVIIGFSVCANYNSRYQVMDDVWVYYHPGKKEKTEEDLVLRLKWNVDDELDIEFGDYKIETFDSLGDWPLALFKYRVAEPVEGNWTSTYLNLALVT